MATVSLDFAMETAQFLSTNFPQMVKNGTNFPVFGLAYDDTTDEAAFWRFVALSYGSGNLTLDLYWYAASATTNSVLWEVQLAAITPETDTQDAETKSLASVITQSDTHLGTTAKRIHKCTVTINQLDSITAGDECWLRIARDANGTNGTDNLAGDVILIGAILSYSDT